MPLYALVDSYLQNYLKDDLEKYFGFVTTNGVRQVASVKRPLFPEMEHLIAPEDPEIFSALVYHLAVAEFAIDDCGRRSTLGDFLCVSGWPLLRLPGMAVEDPVELIRRAGLPDCRNMEKLSEAASEVVYKEVEHTLKHGQVRTMETAAVAAASARLEEETPYADNILGRYQGFCYMLAHDACKSGGPEVNRIRGSILGADRYGLDGVVIFKRLSCNGLRAMADDYVSSLELLEEDGPITVYRTAKGTLRTVIVYTYEYHHTHSQAADAFSKVLAVAERYGVKRLGMNGLELTGDALGSDSEGRAMVRLVTEAAIGKNLEELWFIDPRGAFND